MNSGQPNIRGKNDKREGILQAAWSLIRHYGYNKTTIDDIAKKAGVGKGTVYLYFRSKAEIMLALTDLTNERITKELEKIAAESTSPLDRLRRCLLFRVLTLFDLVHKYPHSEDVIASMLPDIVERLKRYVRRHGELLGDILQEGTEQGDFQTDEPHEVGQLLAGLFEFLTPPYYRFHSRTSLESFANRVIDLLISGIAPDSKVPGREAVGREMP